jgi:hypothetical protein
MHLAQPPVGQLRADHCRASHWHVLTAGDGSDGIKLGDLQESLKSFNTRRVDLGAFLIEWKKSGLVAHSWKKVAQLDGYSAARVLRHVSTKPIKTDSHNMKNDHTGGAESQGVDGDESGDEIYSEDDVMRETHTDSEDDSDDGDANSE